MKTRYYNTATPARTKRRLLIYGLFLQAPITIFVFCIIFFSIDEMNLFVALNYALVVSYPYLFFLLPRLLYLDINEDERTIRYKEGSMTPFSIDSIKSITYNKNRRGHLHSMTIRDGGTRYITLKFRPVIAVRITEHLKRLNPNIEVKYHNHKELVI